MMRDAFRHELKKMLASRNWRLTLLLGAVIVIVHFIVIAVYVNEMYYISVPTSSHPVGLSNISLLFCFMPADGMTTTARLFYIVMPVLAAFPFGASLYTERRNGYHRQVLPRIGKKLYLTAKFLVCALSGFMTVFILLTLDVMLCATVCPLVKISIIDLLSFVGQGSFASSLYYNYPALYIIACVLMSSVWGAVCAVTALSSSMFLSNSFLITIFPGMLMMILEVALTEARAMFFKNFWYEVGPISLMTAEPGHANPSWVILLWQCFYTLLAAAVYMGKGMRRENL